MLNSACISEPLADIRYDEKKEHRDARGKVTRVEVIHKHLAPDTLAQIFWLKNRQPEMWRDRRELDMKGGINAADLAERLDRARNMSDQAKADRIGEIMERARVQEEYEKRLQRGDLAATNKPTKGNGKEKPHGPETGIH